MAKGNLEKAMGLIITDELLEEIQRAFPNEIPVDPKFPVEHFRALQGQQRVVNWLILKKQLLEQNEYEQSDDPVDSDTIDPFQDEYDDSQLP